MNINGKNGLACVTNMRSLPNTVVLKPLPGLPVIRDLFVDMTGFFKQYHSIKPWLVNEDPPPERERLLDGVNQDDRTDKMSVAPQTGAPRVRQTD